MPRAAASSARTSVRQRKPTPKKVAEAADTTPPSSPVVSIPATPRAQRVSPRKKIVPDSDTPAVQIRASATPPVSRRLSFGSAIEGDISASQSDGCSDRDLQPVACDDSDIEVLEDAAAPSPSHKVAKRKYVSPSPPAKASGAKKPTFRTPEVPSSASANRAKRRRAVENDEDSQYDADISRDGMIDVPSSPISPAKDEVDELFEDTPRPNAQLLTAGDEPDSSFEESVESALSEASPKRKRTVGCTSHGGPQLSDVKGKGKASSSARSLPATSSSSGTAVRKSNGDIDNTNTHVSARGAAALSHADESNSRALVELFGQGEFMYDSDDEPMLPDVNGKDEGEQGTEIGREALEFPEIPALFSPMPAHLATSGILSVLQYGEIRPKFTPMDEGPSAMPNIMTVISHMASPSQSVFLYEALLFRGVGVYVNPLLASPKDFTVISGKIMLAAGSERAATQRSAIFVMPIVVESCNLLSTVAVNPNSQDEHLRLSGWAFAEFFSLFSCFMTSVLNRDIIYAYMSRSCLQFTSRQTKASDAFPPSPSTPRNQSGPRNPSTPRNRGTVFGAAFGAAGPSLAHTAWQQLNVPSTDVRYPHVLTAQDDILVYDGRAGHGDFCFTDRDWANVSSLPRYGASPNATNGTPKKKIGKELKSHTDRQFSVALVAFTASTFTARDNPTLTQIGFNVQFAILLGTYVDHPAHTRPELTTAQMCTLRGLYI